MKKIKLFSGSGLLLLLAMACSVPDGIDDNTTVNATTVQELAADIEVSNDNSGKVTITPTAEGATLYTVNFGEGSGSDASTTVRPGEHAVHSYPEGSYTVNVIAKNIAGDETSSEFPLTVTYRAPENLSVNPVVNGYNLSVSAEADYANSFLVFYGDTENEVGTSMAVGETLPPHTYESAGIYDVKVVAQSGGAATSETVVPVTINEPLKLPITFEEEWVNYFFGTFDDNNNYVQAFSIVDNPKKAGLNASNKVGKYTNGFASWSGTYTPMNEPIDFSEGKVIKIMVYNPDPANIGKKLNMELEKPVGVAGDQPYGAILKQPLTKSGEWEELTFDFSTITAIPDNSRFNQLVFRFNDSAEGTGEIIYIDNITIN